MPETTIQLPWGDAKLDIVLPAGWQVRGEMKPASLPGVADVTAEVERSLTEPVGLGKLSSLVGPDTKIALVVDDASRPTPVAKILPQVMAEIACGGGSPANCSVVAALGVHRAMTDDELQTRLGGDWMSQVQVVTHDCDDPEKLANLGSTSRGTPVLINKTVAEADLVIVIGCIEPHIIASFGGGYKNLVPGVAGRATIAHNHTLNCMPASFNNVGQPIDHNPMRLDLEEAAGMLKPPVFMVNAVLNSALEVVQVVSGDPVQAHRAGTETSARIYGVQVPVMADVLITNSFPMDQDLRQGVKALANTIRAVKRGGVMLTLIKADEGVGVFGLANKKLPVGKGMLRLLAPILLPLVPKLNLKSMGEEDRFFLYFALQAMRHGRLLAYAPTIPAEVKENLPFIDFVDSVEEGIAEAAKRFPGKADVLVFPNGGSTYPILPK
jgi:nickel-dependent lactate racemase